MNSLEKRKLLAKLTECMFLMRDHPDAPKRTALMSLNKLLTRVVPADESEVTNIENFRAMSPYELAVEIDRCKKCNFCAFNYNMDKCSPQSCVVGIQKYLTSQAGACEAVRYERKAKLNRVLEDEE